MNKHDGTLLSIIMLLCLLGYGVKYNQIRNSNHDPSFYHEVLHDQPYRNLDNRNTKIAEKILQKASWLYSEEEYAKKYEQINMHVPADLIQNRIDYSNKNGCTKFPGLTKLEFSNTYWQTLKLSNGGTAYFYSAYYDNRELVENAPFIRIISIIRNKDIPLIKYCQMWLPDESKVIIANKTSVIHNDGYRASSHHYILTCEIPPEYKDKVPAAVSLVESECDTATNVLTVHYNQPESGEKEDFALCSGTYFYPEVDMSLYLVQYIELAKLLGIHKLYIYEYLLHPHMRAVLRYYEKQDRVQVIPFTMPGSVPNLPVVLHQFLNMGDAADRIGANAARDDCFYMNMYKYKYIAFFDLDEMMITSNGTSWKESIEDVIKKEKEKNGDLYTPPSSYKIPMGYFTPSLQDRLIPEIPEYMSMLQAVNRTGMVVHYKQLLDTERNIGISNHGQINCVGKCIYYNLDESDFFLAHYRNQIDPSMCRKHKRECSKTITDTRIWHFKEDMITNVDAALKDIGFLSQYNL